MKRIFAFGFAAVLTAGLAATAWSQAGQGGGGGAAGAGGGGAAGSGGAAGAAGAGAASPGAAGPGAAGAAGVAGNAGGANGAGVAGQTGSPGTPGAPGAANGVGAQGRTGAAGTTAPGATAGVPGPGATGNNGAGFGTAGNPSGRGNVNSNGQVNGRIDRNDPQARSGLNNNINRRPFFADPGVQRQLNMNQQQFNTLNRAYQDAYGRYSQNLRGMNANLNDQQRLAATERFENQFRTDFGRSVDTAFRDPSNRNRYDQLNRQYSGFSSFNDPAIQQQLNLTPQQRVQVQRMANDWRNQMQQSRQNGAQMTQQQWEQMWSRNWDQLNGVFTPEQQQTWSQLTGERYSFSPDAYSEGNMNQAEANQGNAAGTGGNVVLPPKPQPTPNLQIVPKGGTAQPSPGTGGGQAQPRAANAAGAAPGTTR